MTAHSTVPVGAWGLCSLLLPLAPPILSQTPPPISFATTADSATTLTGNVQETQAGLPPGTPWQYLGAFPADKPNFLVVSPSSGTRGSSGIAFIGLNPNVFPYLRPGAYGLSVAFGQPGQPPPTVGSLEVQLTVAPPPPPIVSSVVSAASLQPQISPGELISIFGANIGTPPVSGQYNDAGLYPTALGNTTVSIGGAPAALLFVSQTQINAVVPFEVAGQTSVDVVVTHDDVPAPTVKVPIVATSPSIFTTSGTGKGQGAIQNATSPIAATPNNAANPAPPGSVVAIYATGGGLLSQTVEDGSILISVIQPTSGPQAPLSLTIGGQPAQINYAGAAPFEVAGMLQINAVVPQGIGSGAQPVVLKIGANDNSAQQVTVAIK
jgi:uncharacterized protein (TIGR03437 family)